MRRRRTAIAANSLRLVGGQAMATVDLDILLEAGRRRPRCCNKGHGERSLSSLTEMSVAPSDRGAIGALADAPCEKST
jgi:hypothetical protein